MSKPPEHSPEEHRRDRRRRVREMCNVLRSDLYDRVVDPEPEKAEGRAVWESPLKNRCVYSYDEAGEGYQPVQAVLIDSRGRVYAETDDADAAWLDAAML